MLKWILIGGAIYYYTRMRDDTEEGVGGLLDTIFGAFKGPSPGAINPTPYPAETAGAATLMSGKSKPRKAAGGVFDDIADVAADWYNSAPGTPPPWRTAAEQAVWSSEQEDAEWEREVFAGLDDEPEDELVMYARQHGPIQ